MPTRAILASSLLSCSGERKYQKRLVGQDKGKERALTNYLTGKTDSAWGICWFITNQIRAGWWELGPNLKKFSHHFLPSSQAEFNSQFLYLHHPQQSQWDGEMGVMVHCMLFLLYRFFSFLRCFPRLADWSSHQHAYPEYINCSYGCTVLHVSLMQMFGLFLNKTWRVNSCNRKQLVMKDTALTFIIYYDNDGLSKTCQMCGNICTSFH